MSLYKAVKMDVPAVDDDHAHALDLMERMEDAIQSRGDQVVASLVLEFCNYFTRHFANEEQIMNDLNYFDAGMHKTYHGMMIRFLDEMADGITKGEISPKDTAKVIINWTMHHLEDCDARLANYIRMTKGAQ